MKRLLLWLIGVALGVAVLLAAVMSVSYSFTSEGAKPASAVQFAGQELEPNGWCWQVPLLGGQLDKVFASPRTLTVQKLGVLYDAHPAFTLPDWFSYGPLTITDSAGNVVFTGTVPAYEDFLFPANGDYKAELTLWRMPETMLATQFEGGSTGQLRRNPRLEKPAKPTGWYYYSFRFTLQASAGVELSADRVEQGGTIAAAFTGMVGDTAPAVETDLGSVQAVRLGSGWRAYIPAAYNASAGAHEVTFTVGGETVTKNITVIPKDFGTVEVEAGPEASEEANAEFRNIVWPLYEQPAREKLWSGGFVCPAENYMTLVDFGQVKVTGGKQGSKSNSTKLYTIPGEPCRAPAAGVVVLTKYLALTGNTVVIDHGCGLRSYLYGLDALSVSAGQSVERGQAVGTLGEEMTMDFKLGSKSVNPWPLFQTSGGCSGRRTGERKYKRDCCSAAVPFVIEKLQEMASTSHFIWTASAPSSVMWSAPALSMACSGVRAPHRTCRPGIIRAVRAMTSCALVQWYFSQRSPQLSSRWMACARRAGWKQGFVFRVLPSG